jgi:sugar phosphate isomerase/epimerase
MLIGTMNHPRNDVLAEIDWMSAMGLEFIDLTLEPPMAASWRVDAGRIRDSLRRHGMHVVGHTAFYLPLASAFEELRCAAVEAVKRCVDVFAEAGARWVNIHPDHYTPMHDRAFYISRDLQSLRELIPYSRQRGIGLMIENLPGEFNSAAQLSELLDPLPDLGLHLDIGHANLMAPHNTTREILHAYGRRLRHVHLHDNKGGREDLHLPLRSGTLELEDCVGALVECGYDETITLEVFTPDRHYLAYSRDVLRRLWTSLLQRRGAEEHVMPSVS